MLLLGLLLLAATAAFTGLLIADNIGGGPHYSAMMLGNHLATLSTLGAFLAGIALTLLFCLGLAMLTGGASHQRRRSADLKSARQDAAQAAAERDEMAARMRADQAQTAQMPAAAQGEREPVRSGAAGNGHGHRLHRPHLFGH